MATPDPTRGDDGGTISRARAIEIIRAEHDRLAECLMATADALIAADPKINARNMRKAVGRTARESLASRESALAVLAAGTQVGAETVAGAEAILDPELDHDTQERQAEAFEQTWDLIAQAAELGLADPNYPDDRRDALYRLLGAARSCAAGWED